MAEWERQRRNPPIDPQGRQRWLDDPRAPRRIFWIVAVICLGLAAADFTYEHHAHLTVEKMPVFYGIFGFVSFFFLVLSAKGLRKLIRRDEDYYDR